MPTDLDAKRAAHREANLRWRTKQPGFPRRPPRPFPLQPLLDFVRAGIDCSLLPQQRLEVENRRLGLLSRQKADWARIGLDAATADMLAIRIGLHPAEIWGNWFAECPDEDDVVVAL